MDMRGQLTARTWAAILMAGSVAACADPTAGSSLASVIVVTPLAIVQAPLPDAHTGIAYSGSLQVSGGQPPFAWTVISGSLPGGMSLGTNGALNGAPVSAGTFVFGAKVTDGVGATATASFSLGVVTLLPLTIITTTLPAAILGSHYQTYLQASGGAPPFNWIKRAGSLPPGVTQSSGGLLSGTPSAAGTFSFIVEVQGNFGQNASRTMNLVVNGGPLTIVTRLVNAVRGVTSSVALRASGGTRPWTWSFPTAAPPWMALSSTGVLTITGPPSGTFLVNVRLRDANNASTTVSVRVVVSRRVAIVSGAPPDGTVGASYRFPFASSEGPTPYAYSRGSGVLPPGLTLTGAGVLTGPPTTAGNFSFGVKVTAADGTTDAKAYTINIASPPQIPFTTLPAARVGLLYNLTLTAQRGQASYAWTLVSGPAALSLVTTTLGTRLTGTIGAVGLYPVVLRVTDASGAFAQRAFTLTVN
jgi:hypothetical protein